MNRKRVVITGMGAVSPYGRGTEKLYQNLLSGTSGVIRVPDMDNVGGLNTRVAGLVRDIDETEIPRKQRRSMSKMSIFAMLAARDALNQAGLGDDTLASRRLGLTIGSTTGSGEAMESFFVQYLESHSIEQIKSMLFFRLMNHSVAANLAQSLGITGRVLSPSSACSTGCQTVGLAYETIAFGLQDYMLCGGAEEFHTLTAATFDIMMAASTTYNDRPEQASRPFDRQRDGVVCAEGAGVLLLESLDSAKARGANILAEVLGFATVCDTSNIANPGKEHVLACMKGALDDAGLDSSAISYINAHATSTTHGDSAEGQAIAEIFGSAIPVSSLKGHMGHTMAASGALELIGCVKMLEHDTLIPTANLEDPDPECGDIRLLTSPTGAGSKVFLKNSFAMGGMDSSLILGEYHD